MNKTALLWQPCRTNTFPYFPMAFYESMDRWWRHQLFVCKHCSVM